jgi:hypothetical protein
MIEQRDKKFIDVIDIDEWEVETDSGWQGIKRIGKTIPYEKWVIETQTKKLECADEHIVFLDDYTQIFTKDLRPGNVILTDSGPEEVLNVHSTGEFIEMYDLEVDHPNHRYFTNGILSHNTLWLGNIATQAVRASNNVAIITLELNDRKYMKRLGSNLLGIKMSEYKDNADNSELIKKKIKNIAFDNLATPGQLIVKEFPTSQASAIDVENWLTKVEQSKGIKFKIVIIDYINIMKNWRNPNSENTYMKIKQIAEDLRAAAQRNLWAIVTATQTKQSEFDATDLSMNSASESSGLVATVDGMFGIIQDPLMYTSNEYKLKLLANRDEGYKNSYKKFLVDYNYMRISEDPNSQIMNE